MNSSVDRLPSGTVTFLLSDVVGSTRLWERDRESMDAALRRHDEIVEDAVTRAHGTLLKSRGEGDSTFSVFARASDAANAAVAVRAHLVAEDWPTSEAISVRMAIHTGEAVERDGDYFGPAVNRVARLRGVAEAGEILVSQSTAQVLFDVVGSDWNMVDVGERTLKDLPRPERVYALVDGAATPSQQAAPHPLPPASPRGILHGRARELAAVETVLRQAAAGMLHVVEVEGEPGIGKSRLLAEAALAAHDTGFLVLAGGCEQWEIGRPYAPIVTAIDRSGLASDRRWAELRDLLTASQTHAGETPTDGGVAYRAAELLADLLEVLSLAAPVAIVVDDLQWADGGTLTALHTATRRLDALPVAVLLGRRPPIARSAGAAGVTSVEEARTTRLVLEPLDDTAVSSIVRDVVGGEPGDRLLLQARATGGHPLYLLELLSVLDGEGALRRADGAIEVDSVSPPPSLHLTLLRHLSFLGTHAYELLRIASTLGPSFDVRELAAVTGRPAAELVAALDELISSGLLRDDGDRLRFHHDLVREAIYTDIAPAIRVALHADAWHALAAAGMPPLTVARHVSIAAQSGDTAAIDWLRRAADDVVARDPVGAIDLLRRAADLAADDAARNAIMTELAEVLAFAGDLAEAESIARTVLDAGGGGGRVHLALVQALFARGRWTEVVATVEKACESKSMGDGFRGRLLAESALARIWTGDPVGARRDAEEAVELGRASGDDTAVSFGLGHLSVLAAQATRFEEAISLAESGVAASADLRDAHRRHPHIALGMALLGAGMLEEAKAALQEGRRLGERTGTRWDQPLYHAMLALPKLSLGEWDDAVAEAESSLALADELGPGVGRVTALSVIAMVAAHRGDSARANEALAAANKVVEEMGPQWGMMSLGRAAVLAQDVSGDHKRAAALLDFLWSESVARESAEGQLAIAADLARSLLARGETKRVGELADEMTRVLRHTAAPLPQATVLTVQGLAERDVGLLRKATEPLREAGHLPELAAVLADTAELLAEKSQRAPAQEALDAALEIYERLGARHDIAAVTARLRAAGLRAPRRSAATRATFGWESLTKTELSVVRLAAQGLTNPEIGERLFISRRTVQTHLSHVFTKLGMSSRVELAAAAARRQL